MLSAQPRRLLPLCAKRNSGLSPRSRAFQGLGFTLEGGPPNHLLVPPLGDQPHRPFDRHAAPCALTENASVDKKTQSPRHSLPTNAQYLVSACLVLSSF